MKEALNKFNGNAELLLDEVVGALSGDEAREIFDHILRHVGTNRALDIEIGRRDRYELLDQIRREVFVNADERLLEDVVRAMSEQEAEEVFEYIARMHDIEIRGIREIEENLKESRKRYSRRRRRLREGRGVTDYDIEFALYTLVDVRESILDAKNSIKNKVGHQRIRRKSLDLIDELEVIVEDEIFDMQNRFNFNVDLLDDLGGPEEGRYRDEVESRVRAFEALGLIDEAVMEGLEEVNEIENAGLRREVESILNKVKRKLHPVMEEIY